MPSRRDMRVPVANRYFGVFENGEIKTRGIALRRRDTPKFIADVQLKLLEYLARFPTLEAVPMEKVFSILQRQADGLRSGRVPLEALLVTQTLSRPVEEYRKPSPAAVAAGQLLEAGKERRPGQRIRFLYTLGEPGVTAWDLSTDPKPTSLDVAMYLKLLTRAAEAVLQPLGVSEEQIEQALRSEPWPWQIALFEQAERDKLADSSSTCCMIE